MTETWKPIPGYEGSYEVSDLGRVRSLDRVDVAGKPWRGRIRKVGVRRSDGRHQLDLYRAGKVKWKFTYRLVLEAFIGPASEGTVACHNDGDLSNNRLENLRWDTPSENQLDSVAHGTHGSTRKTHCKRGHAFDIDNTLVNVRGERVCRSCRRALERTNTVRQARRAYNIDTKENS